MRRNRVTRHRPDLVPDAPGTAEVVVTARIEREARTLDEKVLAWGNEKVLSTSTERIGATTQRFMLDVH